MGPKYTQRKGCIRFRKYNDVWTSRYFNCFKDIYNSSANPGPGPNGHLGLTASYTGGVNGRAFEIDFYCDENAVPGFLEIIIML